MKIKKQKNKDALMCSECDPHPCFLIPLVGSRVSEWSRCPIDGRPVKWKLLEDAVDFNEEEFE